MSQPLPPRSIIRLDEPTAQEVHNVLTSVIVGHAQATTTYRFYEELDEWLGPWGVQGYPIGYGKFYNKLFTENTALMENPVTKDWVWKTSIYLQEALRDYIVKRMRDGSFYSLTEPELRQAAFESHPDAYARGGLAMVVLTAPELIPVIASIPAAEFVPTSKNFNASVQQVFATIERVAPSVFGNAVAASAGGTHTGIFTIAVQRSQRRFLNELALSRELGNLKKTIESGHLDHIPWLDQVIEQINIRQLPDQGFVLLAGEVVKAAQVRKLKLATKYNDWLNQAAPELRGKIISSFPCIQSKYAANK